MSWYGVGNPGKDAEHCNRWWKLYPRFLAILVLLSV
jgi:hypothetical protein